MRADSGTSGDLWPPDMVLSVSSPNQLLEVLWVREAHDLEPTGVDLPPELVEPPETGSTATEEQRLRWGAVWPFVWDAALEHAGRPSDEDAILRLSDTANGSAERRALLEAFIGPTWRDRVGEDAFDARWHAWSEARFERIRAAPLPELEDTPERRSLAELVPAWRAGLRTVVTIPCRGEFTRVVGEHGLLVTESTREAPEAYGAALERFVQDRPR